LRFTHLFMDVAWISYGCTILLYMLV
jgi:hypothetical protein